MSDRNVETIDILPTLAHELGIQLPGRIDGTSALALDGPERSQKIIVFDFFNGARSRLVFDYPLSDRLSTTVSHKAHLFGVPTDRYQLTGLSVHQDLIGHRLDRLSVRNPDRQDSVVSVGFPEAFSNVNPDGEFLPAHVSGTVFTEATSAELRPLAIAINGIVRATTSVYDFQVNGRAGAWEVMFNPEFLQPGNNILEVLFIRQDATGSVWLEPAYKTPAEGASLNLLRAEAEALYGVEVSGFYAAEWRRSTLFRWTNGDGRLVVPVDQDEPPTELAIDVTMTGRRRTFEQGTLIETPAHLTVRLDGCTLFDSEIMGLWSGRFALNTCPIDSERATVELRSDTFLPGQGDARVLGVAVASVELRH